jgi:autotransporter-associated beta strand protein
VANGNHSINVRVNFFTAPVDVDIVSGSTLSMNGPFTSRNGATQTTHMLTKFGTGTLLLGNADNDYRGATRIVEGTLRLGNNTTTNNIAFSSSITVYRNAVFDVRGLSGGGITLAANQDLSGAGTVRGGVNATASGVNISPGHSPGIMTFDGAGNITLGPSTVLDMEVGGTGVGTGEAGYTFDQIIVDGAGKSFITGGARLNLIALDGRAYMQPYTIVKAVNGAAINFTSLLKDLDETLGNGTQHTEGGWTYKLDYSPSAITLTFVPEPGVLGLAGVGVVLLPRRRRR